MSVIIIMIKNQTFTWCWFPAGEKTSRSNILRFYNNNNINDKSNKIIIPWQITIHFTFFLSGMYACFSMLLKQIHTVQLIFFFRKKNTYTARSVCLIFIWKNVKNSKVRTIIIMKVYIYFFIFICQCKKKKKKDLKYDHLGSYHYTYNVEFLI